MIIRGLPFLSSSMLVFARTIILPFPVRYISLIPGPEINAPVGKSGPVTISARASTLVSGLLMYVTIASHTSVRLCGGILVAMPTAMPVAPFKSRLGSFAGNVSGSSIELSKLGRIATVFFSISSSNSSAILLSFASVYLSAAGLSPSIPPKFPCPCTKGYRNEKS